MILSFKGGQEETAYGKMSIVQANFSKANFSKAFLLQIVSL